MGQLTKQGGKPPVVPVQFTLPRSTAALQRTLAVELQRLSIQFRKQQKAYLNRLRSKDGGAGGGGSGLNLLDEGRRGEEEYDPGFSDMQASSRHRLGGMGRCT